MNNINTQTIPFKQNYKKKINLDNLLLVKNNLIINNNKNTPDKLKKYLQRPLS